MLSIFFKLKAYRKFVSPLNTVKKKYCPLWSTCGVIAWRREWLTHSSVLALQIPWTGAWQRPWGGRVRHD